MPYCPSISSTIRWKTREVKVGPIGIGAHNPIRIQSMTTTDTKDVLATVEQIKALADLGCEIVRVTVQGMKEAEACEKIKNLLLQAGYSIPLVADIHFYPPAALLAVEYVDKVRINPGNFADKRATFKVLEFTDATYAKELEKIEEKFLPLVLKCKALKKALRIGTNHGSLSDRIMNRYGDTPQGMVESALEFAQVCRAHDYHDFLFSMKASNPLVMIQAYRLLVSRMREMGWDYPLHLGVTEAGEGEDGRIKSAIGIGALLLDGLGDTLRVSLTEDPHYEIDPCRRLVHLAQTAQNKKGPAFTESTRSYFTFNKRAFQVPTSFPLHSGATVLLPVKEKELESSELFAALGCKNEGEKSLSRVDFIVLDVAPKSQKALQALSSLRDQGVGVLILEESLYPLQKAIDAYEKERLQEKFQLLSSHALYKQKALLITDEEETQWDYVELFQPAVLIYQPPSSMSLLHQARRFFEWLKKKGLSILVILSSTYSGDWEDVVIQASAEYGALFCDGLGEGIFLRGEYPLSQLRSLSFNILQAARMRIIKTDFISCPSCGRTLFNLQEVSEKIRQRTAHLPGVKIAIMGCIVNGPGEMADADFGYVGSKAGKIDLYVGKTCVEKDIDFAEGDERLVQLIKAHGKWIEPPQD